MSMKMDKPVELRKVGPARRTSQPRSDITVAVQMRWNTLFERQGLLRDDIQRGKECLRQVQAQLAETRSRAEDWPMYERRCGENCLPDLTESIVVNRRVERFLAGWLK